MPHRLPERNPFEIVMSFFITIQNAPGALGLVELPRSLDQALPYGLARTVVVVFFIGGLLTVLANVVPRKRELLRPWVRTNAPAHLVGIPPWAAIMEQAGLLITAVGCFIYIPVLFDTSGYGALTAASFIVGYPFACILVAWRIQKAINAIGADRRG